VLRASPGGDEGGAALLVGRLEVGAGLDEHVERLELPYYYYIIIIILLLLLLLLLLS
jgi:hypothetical protein